MKSKMKSGSLKIAIFALSLLLCFALAIGVSSAFYQAKRQASGTVIMDQGIIIDYKGFGQNATATTWGKGVNLLLFETTDAQPGQNIEVKNTGAVSSIKANSDSVDFYARLKLGYEFYNGETKLTEETLPASFKASDLITTSTNFFGDSWVESSTDGYFYYGSGSTLHKFDKTADFVALFADGAKFIIEGENFEGADNGQGGGFKINETTSINKIVVKLTLETLQGSADASSEGWTLSPISRIDINEIVNKGIYTITIDDLIPDDENRDGEVIIAGDPTQQITITIGSKAFAGCPNLNLSLSDSANIIYQIASDAFANSNGATIMYGLNNVSTALISPSTSGKEVGIENKWKVSEPNLYLFLPSAIESVATEYGDYQYTDSQGTWYFNLIDENGNRVPPTTTASLSASSLASTYATSNLTAVIRYVDNNSSLTTLTIPSRVGTSTGSEMFDVTVLESYNNLSSIIKNTTSVQNVVIPDSATSIGDYAFNGCSSLVSLTIPDGVTDIRDRAFANCTGLTSLTIPHSVTYIRDNAFVHCSGLTSMTVASGNTTYHSSGNCLIKTESKTLILGCKNSVIPSDGSVTSIGESAFSGCTSLTSITLSDSLESIGQYAFYGCTGLTSIIIPDSVTSIGNDAFTSCSGLTSITLSDSLESIGIRVFSGCSGLTSITIPASVTSIGLSAFSGCLGLTNVTISNGVTSIGDSAFYQCWRLTSITIPDSVTSIGRQAFYYCRSLTEVTIGNGETSIEYDAFRECDYLTNIYIGAGVTEVNWLPSSATNVTISENNVNLVSDGKAIFIKKEGNVLELTKFFAKKDTSYSIPSTLTLNSVDLVVTSVESWAFNGFENLTTINIGAGIADASWLPSSVINVTISENNENLASDGKSIFAKKSGNVLELSKFIAKTDTSYDIPSKLTLNSVDWIVTSIVREAFYGCTSLTSITIPDSVTSIYVGAFYGCSKLTSVTIGDGVTIIGGDAFRGCVRLTAITIPDSVTTIGGGAFYGCISLTSVTIGEGVTSIGGEAFYGCTGLNGVYIKNLANWCSIQFGEYSNYQTNPLYHAKNLYLNEILVTELAIPNSVTNIKDFAFVRCTSLTSITIPDSVTSIGGDAFYGCSELTSVTIGDGVTSIGNSAFRGCTSLDSITIPDSVTIIGGNAFYGCSSLTSITIPDSVTIIGGSAFRDCTSLTAITIPDSVTSIESWVFYNCTSLQTAVLPEGITSVPFRCFYGCSNLTTVTIPSTATSIGDSAFENCTNLTTVIWNVTYDLGEFNATVTQKVQLTGNTTNGLTISGTLQAAPTDIESGLTFEGWTDGTTTYPAGSGYTFTMGNRVLKAVWSKCVITFDANGGEGSEDKIIAEKSSSTTLPAVTGFTKNGYKAIGWSTNKDAKSAEYAGEASYTPTKDVTFYVVWEEVKTISFDLNGGTGTVPEAQTGLVKGDIITLPTVTDVTKDGYKIISGWSTSSTATYASYNFGGTYTVGTSSVTFYLVWEKAKTITFDLNGGTGITPDAITSLYNGDKITLPTPVVDDREGYKAIGWSTNKDASSAQYSFGANYNATSDVTFYLVWEKLKTITFDLNGGTGTTPEAQFGVINDSIILPTVTDAVREGYKAIGWSTSSTATSGSAFGATYTIYYSDVTFYLVWEKGVKVTFDLNGGTGTTPDVMYTFNSNRNITLPTPVVDNREGYKALGWSTNKDASSAQYSFGANYNATSDVTFYLVWEKAVKVTFDLNGGTGTTPEAQFGFRNDSIILPTPVVDNRDGYKVLGWATYDYATSAQYSFGDNYYASSDVTFYLVWDKVVKVTFDLNGGTGTTPDVVYTFNSNRSIVLPTITDTTREGYKLINGWSTNKNTTYAQYSFGSVFYADSDVTFYLVWEKGKTITFDLNGGIGVDTPEKIIFFESSYSLTMPTISGVARDGYIMVEGWSTDKNDRNSSYSFNSSCTISSDTIFYLVWRPILTIEFDLDGGTGVQPDPIQTSYDSSFNFNTGVNYTKEGFRFGGWNLVNELGNVERTYSVSEINNGNCWFGGTGTQYTFKANWIAPHSITFYSDETKSQSFTIGPGYYSLDGIRMPAGEQFSKDDCIIIGWSTSANADWCDPGCWVGDLCKTTATELYAVWKPASSYCKVVLDLSDIDGQENITILIDSGIRISDYFNPGFDITNAEGKVIVGWSKTQGATEVKYTNDGYIDMYGSRGETITLYPVWKEKWNDVAIGSLTASQFAQYQAIWEGKNVDNVDWSALQQLNNNNWHNTYSISVYVNSNLYNDVTYNGNSNRYLPYFDYYYQLRNSEYTIKFPNVLSANWKLVNYKYEVIQEGTTQIVDGKSQVTINYSYREILAESDNLIFIFILPDPPAEEISTEINMNVMPGNIYDKLAAAGDNYQIYEIFGGFRYLGILMEVYNADTDQLLYSGTTSYGAQDFATYRLMTGRYKLRVYTTDLVKLGVYSKDDNTEITENITLSDITHGADYSEIIIDYTFVEKAPALKLIFRMHDLSEVADNNANKVEPDFSEIWPQVFIEFNLWNTYLAYRQDPSSVTAEQLNKLGYCFMIMDQYYELYDDEVSYSVYSQYGKYYEDSAMYGPYNPYLVSGETYTFKFVREIYGIMLDDPENSTNNVYESIYNEETKTWDVTITMPTVSETDENLMWVVISSIDLVANGCPAYDENVDYSSYCPWN